MAYYSIRTGGASYEDVDVLLTPRSGGEADLFLSLDWEHRPRLDPVTGQVTGALLSSAEDGEDRLAVRHKRFPACHNGGNGGGCVYIVGVLGRRRGPNAFSLVASAVDATVTLVEGVAVRDAVGSKNYNYYIFTILDVNTDVSISVTPFSGGEWVNVDVPWRWCGAWLSVRMLSSLSFPLPVSLRLIDLPTYRSGPLRGVWEGQTHQRRPQVGVPRLRRGYVYWF